jgi:hypothetical protein
MRKYVLLAQLACATARERERGKEGAGRAQTKQTDVKRRLQHEEQNTRDERATSGVVQLVRRWGGIGKQNGEGNGGREERQW